MPGAPIPRPYRPRPAGRPARLADRARDRATWRELAWQVSFGLVGAAVVRGIHPPLLADRGLAGGLEALALASPVPVELAVDLPHRVPAALASALYFTAAELLTNTTRHAAATRIRVRLSNADGVLRMSVQDDGRGGAQVVAAVATGPDLHDALLAHRPDIAVIDVRLPPTLTDEGLRVATAIRRKIFGLPVLVLSQYVEPVYARELLAGGTGAVGYLLKDRIGEVSEFVDAHQFIFTKLDLRPSDHDHRRVLAVLTYLNA